MFKCIYRKNDGSKDNLLLDKKTRDLAFKQAKELNLTVIEMIQSGKLKTSLLSKTGSSSLKFISTPSVSISSAVDSDVVRERQISFVIGLFLPFILTNAIMAIIYRLRGFIWSFVGSLMVIPTIAFFFGCFITGNVMKTGEFAGLLVSIPVMIVSGFICWIPLKLMKTISDFKYL